MLNSCNLHPVPAVLTTMGNKPTIRNAGLHLFLAAGLLVTFFLPWAVWNNTKISGYHLPSGRFFQVSAEQFNLGNPYPQLDFSFYAFWLIPVLALVTALLAALGKKNNWVSFIAGAFTLSLVTIFFLFNKTLIDLGIGKNPFQMLQVPAYLAAVFGAGLILTARPAGQWLLRIVFLLAGPVFAYLGFLFINQKVWGETHAETSTVKADYTVSAPALIQEFLANDSLANKKYREKMVVVNGRVSQVEALPDSSVNLQFTDSTSGSYIIFAFEKDQFEKLKNIKVSDSVSAKGSCSGSIYSNILSTTSISFKRSTINNQ